MDLSNKLCSIAKVLKANFTLNNQPISYEDVFSATGLLPAIAKRADQLASLCLGYGIGISFEDIEKSKLEIKVKFDDVTPNVLRYLCIMDVICELMLSAPSRDLTPLDELMYD
jgi:intracellular multiplication protein IcmS